MIELALNQVFLSSLHPKGINVYNLVVVPKQPLQMLASLCNGRDQLRLCCTNVQSLRNKSPDFLCYACTMKTGIFAVTENWFSQHDIGYRIKDIHQISLSKQVIISTYNVRSLYQLGKLNQLCCVEAGGRSRS